MKYILALVTVIAYSTALSDEIYKWVDSSGKVHYAEKKPKNQSVQQPNFTKPAKSNSDPAISKSETAVIKKSVVLYSTSSCASCKKARQYFISKAIPFKEMNIEKSREARDEFKNLGAKSVPFIRIGDNSMNDFSRKEFESLYVAREKSE